MLTPLGTKEDDSSKTSTEYYYPQQQSHQYYCPIPFNDDSNNLHHYRPSIYETNHYYTLSPTYLHQQINNHSNEVDSNNHGSSTVYVPSYHHPQQHYSPEEHVNEVLYSRKPSNHQLTSSYDYNLSPVPALPTNPIFHQQLSYTQTPIEQANCSTSNSADYLTAYVSYKFD
jgi:hypothetical protein